MSLTAQGSRAQNRAVAYSHRSVHAVLLVLAFAANGALAPCGGWEALAKARMACCAGEDHPSSQAQADDCCAAGEQRHHSETMGLTLHATVPPPTSAVIVFGASPIVRFQGINSSHADRVLGSPPLTHLLLSVFLI